MPADRVLGVLLRSLQTQANQQETPRLLGTTASLLTTLNNPLNVTLLTSQLLSAPAIWAWPEGLRTSMQCLSVFHSAAQAIIRQEKALESKSSEREYGKLQTERTMPKYRWIKSAIAGADEHSPRWRHLLVIGGLLLGFGPAEEENISRTMRRMLESALVTAVNLSLKKTPQEDELGQETITQVLNHCFPSLSDEERENLNYQYLLPVLMHATFHAPEGLRSGQFLGALDQDLKTIAEGQMQWSDRSRSFQQIQEVQASPLVSSLGPLARLIAHAVERVEEPWRVVDTVEDLEAFVKTLHRHWRGGKLSGIDATDHYPSLDAKTLKITLPALFKLLQSILFASVIILRSAIGRILSDRSLARNKVAPAIAQQTLYILRGLYFITTRQGAASFSQYDFVYYTAMDILGQYPKEVEHFLRQIQPSTPGTVPDSPLERNRDLFFLNTAEHFTLTLSPKISNELLLPVLNSYLAAGGSPHLLANFEAAHSLTLALFSSPQHAEATVKFLPFYVESLFRVFPANLSARQFRLAFKTLLKITSSPSKLALKQPEMPAVLLELLHHQAEGASRSPMPRIGQEIQAQTDDEAPPVMLSEQAIIVLTLIDALTQIPLALFDEWLPLAADMINSVPDEAMREHCKQHFWRTLVDGELDPERSRVCHAWWSTGGGKEWILYGDQEMYGEQEGREEEIEPMMSGALPPPGESKL